MAGESRNYLFTWKIKNFSMCVLKKTELLVSPTFKAESIGGSEWYLGLYKRINNKVNKNVSYFLSLFRIKNDSKEITQYFLEIIGGNGEVIGKCDKDEKVFGNSVWGEYEMIVSEELNEEMIKSTKDILTIRCHLSSCTEPLKQPAYESEGWTLIGVDQCCFLWNVKFSDSPYWNESKTIFIEKKSVFDFTLTAPGNEVEIDIQRDDEEVSQSKHLCCKVSLMTLKGIEFKSISANHTFEGGSAQEEWKIPALFTKNDLKKSANDVFQNDSFTLNFEVSVSSGQYMSEIKNVKHETSCFAHSSSSESISALQDDLRNMLRTSKNADIKLRVESLTIPAHKYILSARSPVFSAMFDQNMLENETGVVDIQDLDAMTLNSLLEFVYTGFVSDLNLEKATKLSIAADKYQIPSLIENCCEFLIPQLSVENACDLYRVADLIRHKRLKHCAMEYVKTKSSEVLSSDTFSDWMKENVNLANEILFKLVLEISP